MDLRGNRITIGEILANPGAKKIAQREFPQLLSNPFAMRMAYGMTLSQALGYAGNLPRERLQKILQELGQA